MFLKVASTEPTQPSESDSETAHVSDDGDFSWLDAHNTEQSCWQHFVALVIKRLHYSKRDQRAICCRYPFNTTTPSYPFQLKIR